MDNQGFDGEEKKEGKQEAGDTNDGVKKAESVVSLPESVKHDMVAVDKPYSGMNKEDLLRFSDTPFWRTLRLVSLIVFWLFWLSLLIAVVVLTIQAPRCKEAPSQQWWQKSTFYQVYVRSFYDTNDDGVGDLAGITEKLDYVSDIGAEAIMISSFYQGDQADGDDYGYQVTDHMLVDPLYGTIEQFSALVNKAHSLGIKVILDFIPNHTSNNHNWFTEWQDSNPDFANYYTTALDCGALNNWVSVYGGSAWDDSDNICYLHQLLETQPDLNLRSSKVKAELETILRYWLDLGVDGFRVIGAKYLVEDYDQTGEEQIPGCDDDQLYECFVHNYTASQPENIALMSEWRAILNEYSTGGDVKVLLSDARETVQNTVLYYAMSDVDGAQMPLNYQILEGFSDTCTGQCLQAIVDSWVQSVPSFGTINWMTGHQDDLRLNTVSSDDQRMSKILNILRMALPGPAIVYYGEELGMTNGDSLSWTGGCTDPGFNNLTIPCRQEARTPMLWDDSAGAGFSNASSWLPINDDSADTNVATQTGDDDFTVLNVFKKLAELKNTSTALQYGDIHYAVVNSDIFSFIREYDGTDRYLITMNLNPVNPSTNDYTVSNDMIPGSAELVVASSNTVYSIGDSVNLADVTLGALEAAIFMWPYSRP